MCVYVCKHQACFQQRILAFQSWQSSQTSLLKKRDEETRLLVAKTLKREKVDYCREEISRVSSSAASALCVGVYGRGGACVGGGGGVRVCVDNEYNQPCDNNLEYSNNTHPIFRPSYHLTAYFQPYEWRPFFSCKTGGRYLHAWLYRETAPPIPNMKPDRRVYTHGFLPLSAKLGAAKDTDCSVASQSIVLIALTS